MKPRLLGLLLPPASWLFVFLLIPTGVVAVSAFSAEGLKSVLDLDTLKLLGRSLRVSAVTTLLCLAIGYPVAWYIVGCGPRLRNLLLFLVVLPFWTNLIVRTYALMFVVRDWGILYTEKAVVLGLTHGFLPFMILPLYASIERLPKRLLEAARDLGASPLRTFWTVAVPLTAPGIAAGCILVFIPVLGSFGTPEIMGGAAVTMVGSHINLCFVRTQNPAAGSALTLLLVILTVALTWAYHRLRKSEGLV